jgi:dipeptidyl aminopeptidase/acylaminoacyl peptidase
VIALVTAAIAVIPVMLPAQAGTAAPVGRPLQVADLLNLRTIPPSPRFASITHDGRWVAYAVRDAQDWPETDTTTIYSVTGVFNTAGRNTQIWITDTRSGTPQQITHDGTNWGPVWSPDGTQLLFYSDRDGAARLWLWNRETNALRRVSDAVVRPFYETAAWSADGKSIAVKLLPEGETVLSANRVSRRGAVPHVADSTIASGATVSVFRSAPTPDKAAQTAASSIGAAIDTTQIDTTFGRQETQADMAIIRVADGHVTRLTQRGSMSWFGFSPDGSTLAFVHNVGIIRGTQQIIADLFVVPTAGGRPRRVATHFRTFDAFVAWSPDGTRLAYRTDGQLTDGDVYVVNVAAGTQRRVTPAGHPHFEGGYGGYPAWLHWSARGDMIFFQGANRLYMARPDSGPLTALTPDGWDRDVVAVVTSENRAVAAQPKSDDAVIVMTRHRDTKQNGFFRVDLRTRQLTKLREEPRRYGFLYNAPISSADGSTVLFTSEDPRRPYDLWVSGPDLATPRQLTHLNPQIHPEDLGDARVIDYVGINGESLHGSLLLPAHYKPGQRYPLLVRVYPGNNTYASDAAFRFGLDHSTDIGNMQLLASRGYAVLYPDVPQRVGTPMKDLVEGVDLAVNKVIELGIADPDRLGVFGQSYGGYSTIAIISQTPRFKAAVMSAGTADLLGPWVLSMSATGASGEGWAVTGQGMMGGSPWEYRERYIENSPLFYLDRVSTPLLIIHGDNDRPESADQIFVALRWLGKEVEYRRYAATGHVVEGPANLTDYWNALFRWFGTHLGVSQGSHQ